MNIIEEMDLRLRENKEVLVDSGPIIDVNPLSQKVGAFYEKIRYAVDYKENHTIRRSAIERILKRQMHEPTDKSQGLALLEELVGGGYLPNREISENISSYLENLIKFYEVIAQGKVDETIRVSLLAAAIDNAFADNNINDVLHESFFNHVKGFVSYQGKIDQTFFDLSLYMGARRAMFEEDNDMLRYSAMLYIMPWIEDVSDVSNEEISNKREEFVANLKLVNEVLEDELGWKISSKLKNEAIYFNVLREVWRIHGDNSLTVLEDKETRDHEVTNILNSKYYSTVKNSRSAGGRAVVYILLTKVLIALALELPYEKFILGDVNHFALLVNATFHPILLFIMISMIFMPGQYNTDIILENLNSIILGEKRKNIYIKPVKSNNLAGDITFSFYAAVFLFTFGIIVYVLDMLNFNFISMLLFLLFLTVVSYFGFRIIDQSKKWTLRYESNSVFALVWEFLTMPIVHTGRWLSRKFSSVNVFVFIMDFILETPFKLILGSFDSFISFMRDKRDDLH